MKRAACKRKSVICFLLIATFCCCFVYVRRPLSSPYLHPAGEGVTQASLFSKVDISEVEKYWNRRPCNSGWKFDGVEFASKEWFNKVEEKKYFVESHIPAFANFSEATNKKVLEIGSGICTTTASFAKAGAVVTTVDISSESLNLCKRRFSLFGLEATFLQGNAEQLDTLLNPEEKFDLIWSFGVIHHTPNPEKVFRHLHNYLAPGGELKIMMYNKFSYKLFQVQHQTSWDFTHMDQIMAKYSEAQTGSPVTYTYTVESLEALLRKTGFKPVLTYKDHILFYDIDKYAKGEYVVADEFVGMDAELFDEMQKELGWHILSLATL